MAALFVLMEKLLRRKIDKQSKNRNRKIFFMNQQGIRCLCLNSGFNFNLKKKCEQQTNKLKIFFLFD